jgi:hypothetical protein
MGWPISQRAADLAQPAVPLDASKAEQNNKDKTLAKLREAAQKKKS